MPDPEKDSENTAMVNDLLARFRPSAERLNPEVEPATVYVITPSQNSPDEKQ